VAPVRDRNSNPWTDSARCNSSPLVVKIGKCLLTNDGEAGRPALGRWVRSDGRAGCGRVELVVVSSGLVAEGMSRLGWLAGRSSAMIGRQPAP